MICKGSSACADVELNAPVLQKISSMRQVENALALCYSNHVHHRSAKLGEQQIAHSRKATYVCGMLVQMFLVHTFLEETRLEAH